MKPWSNAHTVAMLWLIAACIALGWIAGLVSIHEQALQWDYVTPAPKPATVCVGRSCQVTTAHG